MPPLQAARIRLEKAQVAYDEWIASGGERLNVDAQAYRELQSATHNLRQLEEQGLAERRAQ
jgi:hypothetical protein